MKTGWDRRIVRGTKTNKNKNTTVFKTYKGWKQTAYVNNWCYVGPGVLGKTRFCLNTTPTQSYHNTPQVLPPNWSEIIGIKHRLIDNKYEESYRRERHIYAVIKACWSSAQIDFYRWTVIEYGLFADKYYVFFCPRTNQWNIAHFWQHKRNIRRNNQCRMLKGKVDRDLNSVFFSICTNTANRMLNAKFDTLSKRLYFSC